MFVDLDWPLNASSLLSAAAELLVLLCICVVSCPYVIYYPTVMAWYGLFVLKVPLNPKQTNKQTFPVIVIEADKITSVLWHDWFGAMKDIQSVKKIPAWAFPKGDLSNLFWPLKIRLIKQNPVKSDCRCQDIAKCRRASCQKSHEFVASFMSSIYLIVSCVVVCCFDCSLIITPNAVIRWFNCPMRALGLKQ